MLRWMVLMLVLWLQGCSAVKLGYRKELEAMADPAEQKALYDQLVARLYAAGKATSMAAALEIDAVIDPAETRDWLLRGLAGARVREDRPARYVDPW